MSDYIKREDAIEEFEYRESYSATYVRGFLKHLPSVDVAPVRHGHWIDDAGALRCSECGVSFPDLHPLYEHARYCPNCGSIMYRYGDENE